MAGRGQVEISSNIDCIIDLINKGYSFKMIYRKLNENGKITINYKYFCALLRRYGLKKKPEQYFLTMIDREKSDIYKKIKHYKEHGMDFNNDNDSRKKVLLLMICLINFMKMKRK